MKKKVRLLLTSVGGLVAPGMIKSLRSSEEYDFHIIGVDTQEDAVGFNFSDAKYVVPRGNDVPSYVPELFKIACKEKVDVIVPLSDEETLSLAEAKTMFEEEGIKITCSDYETVKIASDKASMLNHLKENGLDVPEFYTPKNLDELKDAVGRIGYPKKEVVLKPTNARGARGFCLLKSDIDKKRWALESRSRQEITLDWMLDALHGIDTLSNLIVMEYLPGDDFNVDVLAKKGRSIYIIPNKRIVPSAGPVQVGHILEDKKVENLAREAVKIFGFDYYVNIEMAYRAQPQKEPFIYEINPRASAPIVANKAAGVDLLVYGIKLALGDKIDEELKIRETKMVRFWDEVFTKP